MPAHVQRHRLLAFNRVKGSRLGKAVFDAADVAHSNRRPIYVGDDYLAKLADSVNSSKGTDAEFGFTSATWMEADEAIWSGVELASRPWDGIFPPIEWTEENARNLDKTVVTRADEVLKRWSTAPFPEWYSPEETHGIEGFAGTA